MELPIPNEVVTGCSIKTGRRHFTYWQRWKHHNRWWKEEEYNTKDDEHIPVKNNIPR